ncbi:MAG: hypothetical protein AAF235_07585 [Planctomycetota bacterium]
MTPQQLSQQELSRHELSRQEPSRQERDRRTAGPAAFNASPGRPAQNRTSPSGLVLLVAVALLGPAYGAAAVAGIETATRFSLDASRVGEPGNGDARLVSRYDSRVCAAGPNTATQANGISGSQRLWSERDAGFGFVGVRLLDAANLPPPFAV